MTSSFSVSLGDGFIDPKANATERANKARFQQGRNEEEQAVQKKKEERQLGEALGLLLTKRAKETPMIPVGEAKQIRLSPDYEERLEYNNAA